VNMASATATGPKAPGLEPPPQGVAPPLPPGPRAPATLQTLAWALAPTWLMTRCARHLGDSFTLTFAPSGIRFVMISDPDAVKELFTAPAALAPSGAGNSPVAGVMGPHSVVVLTGPEHMRQRKLLLPSFHGERMREYEQVIAAATRSEMARWRLGAPVSTLQPMRRITLEVILRAVFGVEAERMSELRSAIGDLLSPSRTLGLLRAALRPPAPGRPPGDVGRALDRLDDLIYAELTRRRAAGDLGERKDILSLLMQARDEHHEPMSDAELRDELVTLLLAGHETTATSVAWALERLVRHPASLGRLIAEVDAGEGDRYMNAVINETLRVRPVVPLVVRVLTGPMRVGDRVLPQGTRVVPSIYLTNRNPRVYEHPGEFRPERFLEGAPDTFAWVPFGGGIRRCIGASFAQFEMKVILSTILAGLLPRRPSGLRGRRGELTTRRVITLVPARGARVIWERRRG
jgi:cytochrome P450